MLDQGDGHSSRVLTGEDRRMAKKFKKAARQASISMQTPTPKRNGKKHQKLMQGEGFMKLKSKKGPSGTAVGVFSHCQIFMRVVTLNLA
jgi:hypothetical protein